MATNQDKVGPVHVFEESAGIYNLYAGDDGLPTMAKATRDALQIGLPLATIDASATATASEYTLTARVLDIDSDPVPFAEVRLVLHAGDFAPVSSSFESVVSGIAAGTGAKVSSQVFLADANGWVVAAVSFRRAYDNIAALLTCLGNYAEIDAASIPGD